MEQEGKEKHVEMRKVFQGGKSVSRAVDQWGGRKESAIGPGM